MLPSLRGFVMLSANICLLFIQVWNQGNIHRAPSGIRGFGAIAQPREHLVRPATSASSESGLGPNSSSISARDRVTIRP